MELIIISTHIVSLDVINELRRKEKQKQWCRQFFDEQSIHPPPRVHMIIIKLCSCLSVRGQRRLLSPVSMTM